MLTAIHGASSFVLFGISHGMPLGGIGGGVGYMTALAAFIINLPGVLTIRQFYTSSPDDGPLTIWVGSIGMILITDIYLFLFLTIICMIISRMKNWEKHAGWRRLANDPACLELSEVPRIGRDGCAKGRR